MAQLGELARASSCSAPRAPSVRTRCWRARCVVADAEVALALAQRDLGGSPRPLAAALATLEARGDRANALQAHLIAVRRLVLLGRLDEAASGVPTRTLACECHAGTAFAGTHLYQIAAAWR